MDSGRNPFILIQGLSSNMASLSDQASHNVIGTWWRFSTASHLLALIHSTIIINLSNFSAFHLSIHGSSGFSTAVILLPNFSTEDFQLIVIFEV